MRALFRSPLMLRIFSRFWPPFLGAGIRVTKTTQDLREIETRMKLRYLNMNPVGSHYGGSLFSMTDPFYMLMLIYHIGKDHFVWDKSATIEFCRPARSEVRANFVLTDEMISNIIEKTKDSQPHFMDFQVDILDTEDSVVAKVNKTLYIRRKPSKRETRYYSSPHWDS